MALADRAGILGRLLSIFRPSEPAFDLPAARLQAARLQQQYEQTFETLAARMWDGEFNTTVGFRMDFASELRAMHLSAAAAAKGGFGNLTAQDRDIAIENVIFDVRFLNRWVAEIDAAGGPQATPRGRFLMRARLYAGRVNTTFNEVLTAAQTQGVALPFQPGDRTQCRTNCTCRWSDPVRQRDGALGFYWILRLESQHCETCPHRAQVFSAGNPLIIRGGQIVDDGRLSDPLLYA